MDLDTGDLCLPICITYATSIARIFRQVAGDGLEGGRMSP